MKMRQATVSASKFKTMNYWKKRTSRGRPTSPGKLCISATWLTTTPGGTSSRNGRSVYRIASMLFGSRFSPICGLPWQHRCRRISLCCGWFLCVYVCEPFFMNASLCRSFGSNKQLFRTVASHGSESSTLRVSPESSQAAH